MNNNVPMLQLSGHTACMLQAGIMDTWEMFFSSPFLPPTPSPPPPPFFLLLLLFFFLLLILFSHPSVFSFILCSLLYIPCWPFTHDSPCLSFSSIKIITGAGKGNFVVGHDTWDGLKMFFLR